MTIALKDVIEDLIGDAARRLVKDVTDYEIDELGIPAWIAPGVASLFVAGGLYFIVKNL